MLLEKGTSLCLDQGLGIYLEDVISIDEDTPQARLIKSAMLADKFFKMETDLNIHGTNFLPAPDEVKLIASRLHSLVNHTGKPEGFETYVAELGVSAELKLILIKAVTDYELEDTSGEGDAASLAHVAHSEEVACCGAGGSGITTAHEGVAAAVDTALAGEQSKAIDFDAVD